VGHPESDAHRPSFYAAASGGWRDWWTLLHPPYTAWHLSYVVIGACLAPHVLVSNLVATLLAFFAAVGVSAHALDELHGRPLGTKITATNLWIMTAGGLAVAIGLGALGVARVGPSLLPFLLLGPLLVIGYNYELLGGLVHNDVGFALAWGAFPVVTAYAAQTGSMGLAPIIAAAGAVALSLTQRSLSTPARLLRRQVAMVSGRLDTLAGNQLELDRGTLLAPLERALRAASWAIVLVATALAIARLAPV
jgi:hypothetical protein